MCMIQKIKMFSKYKKLLLSSFLLALFLFFFVCNGISFQKGVGKEVLVKNVLKAYGGEDNLRNTKNMIIDGEVNALFKKKRGTSRIYIQYPDRFKIEIRYKDSYEVLILNKDRGWKSVGGDFVEVKGPPLDVMLFSFRTINVPLELLSPENDVSYSGLKQRGDKIFEVLEISNRKNKKIVLYIDPKTYLIKRVKGFINLDNEITELEKEYGNFKKIDGIFYPYSAVSYASGSKKIFANVREIILNPQLTDKMFMH